MGKSNKNKKGMAEKMANKSKKTVKLNPFDVRFIKSKQAVPGQKNKNDIGKPGVARAKALKKRKETLLQEYNLKNKSNMFMDKRIGEKDSNLSAEEKMIARFTAERIKGSGKTSIFNLGDDYNLTHGGSKIEDIDHFDDPKSGDEDEDELLNKEFVDEAHFGGFMTKADDEFKMGKGNSRKEYIENLIKESKKKKAEKRKADEEAEEKTRELDDNWKGILRNMQELKGGKSTDEVQNYDPYDMLVKQLGFEKKEARGGERLKTDEEKIKDELERLKSLEEDRQRRMRGEMPEKKSISVEDTGEENFKLKEKITRKEQRRLLKELLKNKSKEDEEASGEDSGEEEDEESDSDEEEQEEDEEDSDEESDNYSDLEEESDDNGETSNEKDVFDQNVNEMIAAASEEIPYVIPIPDSYTTLCSLVWGKSPSDQSLIFSRILSCNHPQLGDHKPSLIIYYGFLLQLVQDISLSQDPLPTLSVVFPHIFALTGFFQQDAATSLLACIKTKQEHFQSSARPRFPALDTIFLLRLVHVLFPTSDYRHPVVTPALNFMCSIMATARPTDRASFTSALLLTTTMVEYISLSKRVVPELVNVLHGLLFVSSSTNHSRPPPPCKGGNHLVIREMQAEPAKLNIIDASSNKEIDDEFRASALQSTLTLLIKIVKLYRDVPSSAEIFSPLLKPLSGINRDVNYIKINEMINQLVDSIKSLKRKKAPVVKPAKQVPMLRMMEPKVEEDFEPLKKKRFGSKELLEEQKLRHKLKQEKKGARKEIRQDTAFLASQRMKEARMKDEERQSRTKALFSSLANQEGDYKKMLKKKKKF